MFTPPTAFRTPTRFLLDLQKELSEYETVTDRRQIKYLNVPAAFDIEVSSFYEKLEGKHYDNPKGDKRAIMYIWQFGINDLATYGRTWDEYHEFIHLVSNILGLEEKYRLAVYIHNLPYEFQFIRKRFEWTKVFILKERSPVYALTGGIEYRCSLKLAGGKSLENVAKDLLKYKAEKMVGDLDYLVIRTPNTPLTTKELGYALGDIAVLLAYIQEKIEHDGNITKIPITNTGYVRNYCRKACFKRFKRYRKLMEILQLTPQEYKQLQRVFIGGFTHANAHFVGQVLENVGSHDFTSSYPAVMVLERFPMSRPTLIDHELTAEQFNMYLQTHCCMFDIEMYGLRPKNIGKENAITWEHPLSHSKCVSSSGVVEDNGRVVVADYVKTSVTEQDYFIFKEFYECDKMVISEMRVFEKDYLPTPFVRALLDLYLDKTKLKGVAEELVNYNISKNMLNAAYGMIVTAIVRDSWKYVEDEFKLEDQNIEVEIEKYNKNIRRFLYYPWGVWVTAYARANLFSGILAVGKDYVYSDTDSLKILHPERHVDYFKRYNQEIEKKIEESAAHHGIPVSAYAPLNKKGKICSIGVWDDEGVYGKFKTLGAKRYMTYRTKHYTIIGRKNVSSTRLPYKSLYLSRKGYSITLAGANKGRTREYLARERNPLLRFDDELIIPKESSGKLTLTYIDYETHGVVYDYLGNPYEYDELSSVHMEPTEYELSIYAPFRDYVNAIKYMEDF